MTITRGIDTSSYQDPTPTTDPSDDINWDAVERTAQDFAIIRLTIGRTTDDVTGLRDLHGAVFEGIPIVGAYGVCGYAEPVEDGAKRLVDRAATVVDPSKICFMVDAEDFGDGRHPTIDQVSRYAVQLRKDTGRWPVAYVPSWWLSKYGYSVAGLELRHCGWAQSHYFGQPWSDARLLDFAPTNLRDFDWLAWLQFASSGTVSGVQTRVDLNAAYLSISELRAKLGLGKEDDLSQADAEAAIRKLFHLPEEGLGVPVGQLNNAKLAQILVGGIQAESNRWAGLQERIDDAAEKVIDAFVASGGTVPSPVTDHEAAQEDVKAALRELIAEG
jgi:hypothetical protein